MQARTIPPLELLLLILGVSAIVLLVTGSGFVFFRRFLNREKDRADRFRSVHGPQRLDE